MGSGGDAAVGAVPCVLQGTAAWAGPALAALMSPCSPFWGINEFSHARASLIVVVPRAGGAQPSTFQALLLLPALPGREAALGVPVPSSGSWRAAGRAAEGHSKGSGGICCRFSHLCPLDVPLRCCSCCCAAAPWAWLGAPPAALDTMSTASCCHPAACAS